MDIADFLRSHAPLDRFFVHVGLIHYVDEQGRAWLLMDDDDARLVACAEFLRRNGNPVLATTEDVDRHVARLRTCRQAHDE